METNTERLSFCTGIRMPPRLRARIAAETTRLRERTPGLHLVDSDTIRLAIERGLSAMESEHG